MCGICGRLELGAGTPDEGVIRRMCSRLAHRGPDDEGVYVGGPVALAQRRLAIIDLDRRGTAPLANEDGSILVTFNGEIYNYAELRADLRRRGHTFRTEGDTEVLVHLYEEYGVECVRHLRGMFAFAIWDAPRERLYAARDPLGKKPFVYAVLPEALVFASEMQALLADPGVPREPDYAALDQYLQRQYMPGSATGFRDVRKLPAGHWLTCDRSGALTVQRYWSPPAGEKTSLTEPEIREAIVERLREAVRRRLVADVPVGAFLSGGIDSSAVVALMAEESGRAVPTFSLGVPGWGQDETPYARRVAERYGTEHHEYSMSPPDADLMHRLARHYGMPFADSSALPTWAISREAAAHLKVVLSGDGGDESFAGYDAYADVAAWQAADRVPAPVRRSVRAAGGACLQLLPATRWSARFERGFQMLGGSLAERYELHMSTLKPQERRFAYTPAFAAAVSGGNGSATVVNAHSQEDALDWMMRHDQGNYLPECLMVKVDIAAMANGLEVRAPFLDQDLVAFAATIPSALKLRNGQSKQILRAAVAHLLPRELLEKPKSGFGIPVAAWLRGELKPLVRSCLLDDRAAARGIIRPEFSARLVADHESGRRDWHNRIWALLMLELWFREMVDA